VRHHHERLDGRGYPDRLSGEQIPLGARIIAVADTFDAITSSRPYRSAVVHHKAIEILKKEVGSQLDPQAVAAFLSYYSGSRSASRWTFLVTAPERIAASLRQAVQTTTAAPIAKNAIAVAATAVLGSSLAAPIANAVQGGDLTQRAQRSEIAQAGGAAGNSGTETAKVGPAGATLRVRAPRVAGEHRRSSATPVAGGQPVTGDQPGAGDDSGQTVTPEHGNGSTGQGNSPGKKPASAPGRPSSPGRSDSAPGQAHRPASPPGQANKPTPPSQGGNPPGLVNKPASPGGGPPADSPSNAGGNGNGGNGGGKK
jgi:HD domain-containing protein